MYTFLIRYAKITPPKVLFKMPRLPAQFISGIIQIMEGSTQLTVYLIQRMRTNCKTVNIDFSVKKICDWVVITDTEKNIRCPWIVIILVNGFLIPDAKNAIGRFLVNIFGMHHYRRPMSAFSCVRIWLLFWENLRENSWRRSWLFC